MKTALHIAAERGILMVFSALLQNGAEYYAVDGKANNALHIAVPLECRAGIDDRIGSE